MDLVEVRDAGHKGYIYMVRLFIIIDHNCLLLTGQGVFAKDVIPKGTFICTYVGEEIDCDTTETEYVFEVQHKGKTFR